MRSMLLGAALLLAACASSETEVPVAAPAPPPPAAERVVAQQEPGPSAAAPGVSVEPDRPQPPVRDGDVVVRGTRQLPPPGPADTRTVDQRTADIRRWDNCVMRGQDLGESDPTRPSLDTPEEICQRTLGMSDRLAVPTGRR
jgi:hypothetical protein